MTAEALAKTIGISVERLNSLEEGGERLSADLIRKLSHALQAAPAEFFEGFSVTAPGLVRLTNDDAKAADEEARLTQQFARIRDENARQVILALVSSYAVFGDVANG